LTWAYARDARFSQAIIFWAFSPLKFGLREQLFVTFRAFFEKSGPCESARICGEVTGAGDR
jgi:hypothetical protein